jgi:glycosyltransferase involved in cell wall biosynthesis
VSRIKALHLISTPGPHPWFDTLAEHVDRDRFEISVGCVGAPGALQEAMSVAGVATFALHAPDRRQLPVAVARLARVLRRRRVDVVQTHLPEACLVGSVAARLAGTPATIFTAHHSHEVPLQGNRRLLVLDRLCAGVLSDRAVAPSAHMKDVMVQAERIPPDQVDVIEHGFDLERLDPASVSRDEVRQRLGLEDRIVVGALGRSYWIKNYDTLVRAFAAMADEVPEAVLAIAGPGHEGTERLAMSLGIADRVRVLGPWGDVTGLMAAFDLFAHPAIAESFGMVYVEAMAMGTPVLSAPVGIAAELVETGRTGVRVEGLDVPAWSQAIRTALQLRPAWERMGEAARAAVDVPKFRSEVMVQRYERLYEDLLAPRAVGSAACDESAGR